MEQVEIIESNDAANLQARINQELRQLDGTLIDIKYQVVAIGSQGFSMYSAMIIYKKN